MLTFPLDQIVRLSKVTCCREVLMLNGERPLCAGPVLCRPAVEPSNTLHSGYLDEGNAPNTTSPQVHTSPGANHIQTAHPSSTLNINLLLFWFTPLDWPLQISVDVCVL